MSASALQPKTLPRLADRLATAQLRCFVGRETELSLFHSALQAEAPPFAVLHVYGTGGVGKTTLLRAYARMAAEAGLPVVTADGRHIEPSPIGFLRALSQVMGLDEPENPLVVLSVHTRIVLLIDTYELLAPLDGWLREEFLPQLPGNSLVVLAGRNTPETAWRTGLDWQEVTRLLPLRNLPPADSRAFMAKRGIPSDHHPSVLAFTHGHPLALSLVADVLQQHNRRAPFVPEQEPDVIRMLLQCFLQHVPSPQHREALQICAHVRVTTEALLGAVLKGTDVPAIFEWLRGLSFIEQGSQGLYPHDLARDILDGDFRWRNLEAYREMHRRVRNYYVHLVQQTTGPEQQRTFANVMYLHRNNHFMQYDYQSLGTIYAEPATLAGHPAILAMVHRHEGEDSVRIVSYWLQRQPQAFLLFRGSDRQVIGFTTFLAVHQATPEDLTTDPGMKAVWDFMQRYGPIHSGEEAYYQRFWMGQDSYQLASPAADMVSVTGGSLLVSNSKLAWVFVACADPDYWHPMYTYLTFHRSPETSFSVGKRSYGVFHHDWRSEPLLPWLELMMERELATDIRLDQLEVVHPAALVVLSQPEFADAVRDALQNYHRPAALGRNPLLRSRLLCENQADKPTPAALRSLIHESVEALAAHPKDKKLYRAVHRTYIQTSLTQEEAAECLALPFSTYRYHLSKGLKQITQWLWLRELYGGVEA